MYRALKRIVMGTTLALVGAALCVPLQGSTTWELGDLFVGVGNGQFQLRSNSGGPKDILSAGAPGDTAGCGLDASLNAYLVNTTQSVIVKRALASPHGILQTINTDPNPQSIVFAGNGDFYVGHLGGLIRRYVFNVSTGNFEAKEAHQGTADSMDSFWIDIAADQKTIFYTSGGRNVRKLTVTIDPTTNVATFSEPILPFAILPTPNSDAARALRVLPPGAGAGNGAIIGGLLVADKRTVKRLNAAGAVVQEYDAGSGSQSQDDWFALALDIKDVDEAGGDLAFWAGDKSSGNLWRFNVLSGAASGPVSTGATGTLRGLCLNGEPTTGQYSVLLRFEGAGIQTAVFAAGTPALEEHSVSLILDASEVPSGGLTAVVNAREAISDGLCSGGATNTSDVDCGFQDPFSSDPNPPKAAAYAHGRGVYYHIRWLTVKPLGVVRISSETNLNQIVAAAGTCQYEWPNSTITVTTPRAIRILRDPSDSQPDQFTEDLTEGFYIDEWGSYTTRSNRFIVAARCASGSSMYIRPEDGRTFKAGNSIPIDVKLTNAVGSPITNAVPSPGAPDPVHRIVGSVGTNGQVYLSLGTPGSSPNFFKQVQPGIYSASLQTKGLPKSALPYNFCISDSITPPTPGELPLYDQKCFTFFLK